MKKLWILSAAIINLTPLADLDAGPTNREPASQNDRMQRALSNYSPADRAIIEKKIATAEARLTPEQRKAQEQRLQKFHRNQEQQERIRKQGDIAYAKLKNGHFRTEGERQAAWRDAAAAGRVFLPGGQIPLQGVSVDQWEGEAPQPHQAQ